ncbi:hypothetical protein C9J27_24150 [Photobacterium kishitanii]|uniref:Thioredoxin-like fold domain-containing protein n=1 Tax=Photobacterium kishitanii TaxID=318456 RepID=A0A2T3KAX4_9GAMM|nr:hypothetical protein C9J27_24150 [Photobacterium kishitanii]
MCALGSPLAFASSESPKLFEKIDNKSFVFKEEKTVKFEVLYFFNLNCLSCKNFEPYLKDWKSDLPSDVSFHSVPYSPSGSWQWANLAFFAAKLIDPSMTQETLSLAAKKYNKAIVNIDSASLFLTTTFHIKSGIIPPEIYSKNVIDLNEYGSEIGSKFGVIGTPSIVLIPRNGATYRISPEFVKTYKGILNITDALIAFNSKRTNE